MTRLAPPTKLRPAAHRDYAFLGTTQSLCPECLGVVSAKIIARETVKAIRLPATQEKLTKTGVTQMILTPAEFDARIRAEIAANGAVAKAAGIKPN